MLILTKSGPFGNLDATQMIENSPFSTKLMLIFANISQERLILVYQTLLYQIQEKEPLFAIVLKLKISEKHCLTHIPHPQGLKKNWKQHTIP